MHWKCCPNAKLGKLRSWCQSVQLAAIVENLTAPILPGLFLLFRRTFAFKLFLFAVLTDPTWSLKNWLLLVAAVNAGCRRLYWPGVLILLVYHLHIIFITFPYTINHHFLQSFLLFALFLFPAREPAPNENAKVDGLCCHLFQVIILSVFFYSGIQKVIHGYYLNGEMFAMAALFGQEEPLAKSLRWGLKAIEALSGLTLGELPYVWPESSDKNTLDIPLWATIYFLGTSWLVVVSEIFLPLLAIFRRTRTFALIALIIVQILIMIASAEFSISFTSLACLLLFFPKQAYWTYRGLLAIQCIVFLMELL